MTATGGWVVYQPLIVGLGAVVLASLGNTLLEWFRQHLSQSREAQKVRRAFLEEITIHRKMFADVVSGEQPEHSQGTLLIPAVRFQPIYDNMIGKIGVLEANEIAAILQAYSQITLNPKNLGVLGQYRQDDFSAWVEVNVKYATVVDEMHKAIVAACDEAIGVLARRSRG